MYVCYSRSKNESHAKAVLYHLENWGFTMPEEDGEKNIMREVTYEQECESIARLNLHIYIFRITDKAFTMGFFNSLILCINFVKCIP